MKESKQLRNARRDLANAIQARDSRKGSDLAVHEAQQKVRYLAGGVNDNGQRPTPWWKK